MAFMKETEMQSHVAQITTQLGKLDVNGVGTNHIDTLLGHCKIHSQEPDEYGPGAYVEMLPDDFCSYFEPKRPMQPNTNQIITDLQREIRDQRELGQPTAAVVKSLQEMEKEAGHDK